MAASRKQKDRRGTGAERWTASLGTRGYTVRVQETGQPGGIVKMFWYDNGQERKESLGFRIRDGRGRVILDRKREALRRAEEKSIEIATGDADSPNGSKPRTAPLTLEAGFERFFSIPGGKYAAETRDVRYLKSLRDRILKILDGAETWGSTVPTTAARELGQSLARANKSRGTNQFRKAERTVDLFLKVGVWLAGQNLIEDWRRPKKWGTQFGDDWESIVGSKPDPKQPRYTTEELSSLVASFDHPDLHPKAGLLFHLTWGIRIEQVVKVWRSQICREDDGRVTMKVEGSTHKRAGMRQLDTLQVARLEEALTTGYLGKLEAAYQAGLIDDYPIFPQGELQKGKSALVAHFKVADRSWIRTQVDCLETLAGVEHRAGRGWRGVRRRIADLNENLCNDRRVLDHEGDWASLSTRGRVYQEAESRGVMQAGARLREKLRAQLSAEESGADHGLDVAKAMADLLRKAPVDPRVGAAILALLDAQAGGTNEAP